MIHIQPIPAYADNYLWLLSRGADAWVVDPGDAAPVRRVLQERGLNLAGILVTHHHADHVGGLAELAGIVQGPIVGPGTEGIRHLTRTVAEADVVEVLGERFAVLEVPGHTRGHIVYAQQAGAPAPLLLCGDTLFSGGCGRLFEGTPAQMAASLAKLLALRPDTRVCCTHEYTLSNLRFAAAVEPANADLLQHQRHCESLRANDQPTLPSSLALEARINPFLRCTVPAVAAAAQARGADPTDAVAVFAALREWKNSFR